MADDKDKQQGFVAGSGEAQQAPVKGFVPGAGDVGHPEHAAAAAKKTSYTDVMLGNAPATDLPLSKPDQWDDVLAPTERGLANVVGGTVGAVKGTYNMFRHPIDTAKGIAAIPAGAKAAYGPGGALWTNTAQGNIEAAENTAGQGAGQALVALGTMAAPRAVPPAIRLGARAIEAGVNQKLVPIKPLLNVMKTADEAEAVKIKIPGRDFGLKPTEAPAAPKAAPKAVGEQAPAAPKPLIEPTPKAPSVSELANKVVEQNIPEGSKGPSTHPERAVYENAGLSRTEAAATETATRKLTNVQFGEWAAKNGFDMGDKAIGRGAADVKAGTHITRAQVVEGLLKQGMKPGDITESIKTYLGK